MVDPEFISKVICWVDDRLYQWLKQCARATYTTQTTTELTSFGDISLKILTNKFHYTLPISVKKMNKQKQNYYESIGDSQKRVKQNSDNRVINPAIVNK